MAFSNGEIHYKWSFSIAMLNYQRVHGLLTQDSHLIWLSSTAWWLTYLSEKYESQWEGLHPIYEMENKIHVPNHQPVHVLMSCFTSHIPTVIPHFRLSNPPFSTHSRGVRSQCLAITGVYQLAGANKGSPTPPVDGLATPIHWTYHRNILVNHVYIYIYIHGLYYVIFILLTPWQN